ncbi:MAG: tetratricopeptide repeat protein [Tepidisphaeraceae bacterium]
MPSLSAAPTTAPVFDTQSDIDLGIALLKESDFSAAQSAFEGALRTDPKNGRAALGVALCLLGRDQLDNALPYFERAIRLNPVDRAAVLNAAAARMQAGDPLRAAKTLSDYLPTQKDKPLDEPIVNALGTALAACDEKQQRQRLFVTSRVQLDAAIARLESARAGYHKFGQRWLTESEFAKLKFDTTAAEDAVRALERTIENAAQKLDQLRSTRDDLARKRRQGAAQDWQVQQADLAVEQQIDRVNDLQRQRAQAMKVIVRPRWPAQIEFVAIDDNRPAGLLPIDGDEGTTGQPSPASHRGRRFAAGFAVAADKCVTSALAVQDAGRVTVWSSDGASRAAKVARVDEKTGLALLTVDRATLTPLLVAAHSPASGSAVKVSSFPVLNPSKPTAQTLDGSLANVDNELILQMARSPGLGGAPAVVGDTVAGVVMTDRFDVTPPVRIVPAETLREFLGTDLVADGRAVGNPADAVLLIIADRSDAATESQPAAP